jgi:putative ABC transport system permease protein
VGRTLRWQGTSFRIVGVLDKWQPNPHFYDLNTGSFAMPSRCSCRCRPCWSCGWIAMDRPIAGAMAVVASAGILPSDSCVWLQFWVQLDSPRKAAAYKDFLLHYSQDQKAAGPLPARTQRAPAQRDAVA